MRRILLILAVVLVGSLGVVTAASGGQLLGPGPNAGPGSGLAAPDPQPGPVAAATTVGYDPAPGAAEVTPAEPATVTATGGTLRDVALRAADGTAVEGELSADGTSWSSTGQLEYDTSYTWSGTASGGDGAPVALAGSFTTVAPAEVVRGVINIGDDRTVGIAAPVRIQFNDHVEDRAAVERALSVQTSVPVEGSWGWLPDENGGSRVDYRPREYWPAGTEVTVTADLFGVAYGEGRYGAADVTTTFEIGRAQVVRADAATHRVVVVRDGQQVADWPASFGLDSDPERNTRSGIHVVTEKFEDKRMVSERYDYDVQMQYAVRISNNGEFLHANPASAASQGSANVSHGCINLPTDAARQYYESALYGDPVEVTGTGVQLGPQDGDISDWTYSWEQWQGLSAL
jgi:lipoprotein-anchoring transpeptidase ErfK/SrfK